MAYRDFTLEEIEKTFGVKNFSVPLFGEVEQIEPSEKLKDALQTASELPVRSEKAKSELIVLPILLELWEQNNKFFTIYSGEHLNADEARGLKGECDFIIAKDVNSFSISYPIIQIVEAKKNDIELGVPQCAAQLIGAKVFNQQKNVLLEKIYGCVTTGNEWLFMVLENDLKINNRLYYLNEIKQILAVFQQIIDYFKKQLN